MYDENEKFEHEDTVEVAIKRILLVDDDKYLLDFFKRILSSQGFITVTANQGNEARDILNDDIQGFDMIILDLLMPVESGWKLIEYLHEHESYSSIPTIAMTGLSLSFEEYERIRKQCSAVILKGDFEIERFTTTVYELLS